MKKILWFATIAAMVSAPVLTGCSKEQRGDLPAGKRSELVLKGKAINISGSNRTVAKATGDDALTAGTQVGVHIVDLSSGETIQTAPISNRAHTADATGTLNLDDPDQPIILTTGYLYDVYAYAPYVAGMTGATASAIPVAHGVDCLWVKAASEKPNAAKHTMALSFLHKTSQIGFQIVADPASNPDITGATLEVIGFYGDGTMDLATGNITVGSVDPSIKLTSADPVCFLPATGQMDLNVKITIPAGKNAGDYSNILSATFAPGKSYTYTITVVDRNSELGMTGTEIPWVEETGSVDVTN